MMNEKQQLNWTSGNKEAISTKFDNLVENFDKKRKIELDSNIMRLANYINQNWKILIFTELSVYTILVLFLYDYLKI